MSNANSLFDALRGRFEIKNDARLAKALGVSHAVICKSRQRGEASDGLLIRIHETLGVPFKEIRQMSGEPAPQQ